jgi:CDP-paratose 2-epimerase
MTHPAPREGRCIVIVGGAGFVGCNLAHAYATEGARIRVVDNLSRAGSEKNLDWLARTHGDGIEFRRADIRDDVALAAALEGASAIFHMAAQVAVTTSLEDPRADFMTNAGGTLNLLEHVRTRSPNTPVVFASTNKVYGCLEDIGVRATAGRYDPVDETLAARGIDETRPLALRTPYGCSKGAADQYVLDYAKTFGLKTTVMRMSCIYGPRQFGNEDQGWVAHFAKRALCREQITIFGDGGQVRDILHVNDAVLAYKAALTRIDAAKGEAFNLGGGPANAISLLQLIDALSGFTREPIRVRHSQWRSGDQPWFVADTGKLAARLGWRAQTGWRTGLQDLIEWLRSSELPAGRGADAVDAPNAARRSA